MAIPNNSAFRGEPENPPQKPEVDAWKIDQPEAFYRGLEGNQEIA